MVNFLWKLHTYPALIITAKFDVLHDEGALYMERLKDDGVPVIYKEFSGMVHGFAAFTGILPESRQALGLIAKEIKKMK